MTVYNSRNNFQILFKILTLILKAIISYHTKNQCVILSRYDFTDFLIMSLFEFFSFTVNISLYYFPINLFSAGNFWMLLMTKLKSELKTGIFSLVLSYIIDNWCTFVQLLKLGWASESGLSSSLILSKVSGTKSPLQGVPKFLMIFLFFKNSFYWAKGPLKILPISIQIITFLSIFLSKFMGCSLTNFEILIGISWGFYCKNFWNTLYFSFYYHPTSHAFILKPLKIN